MACPRLNTPVLSSSSLLPSFRLRLQWLLNYFFQCCYNHHTTAKPRLSGEVDAPHCQSVKIEERQEWEKHVILLIDEMHIKEGLVFEKNTGKKIIMHKVHVHVYLIFR